MNHQLVKPSPESDQSSIWQVWPASKGFVLDCAQQRLECDVSMTAEIAAADDDHGGCFSALLNVIVEV